MQILAIVASHRVGSNQSGQDVGSNLGAAYQFRTDPPVAEPAGGTVGVRDLAVPPKALEEFDRSMKAFQAGNVQAAAGHLEKAIKIAPDFVHNMIRRPDDAAIVQAMITMAKGFDMRVVAEGVETKEQLSYLLNRRCTEMQGFFLGKPLPASSLSEVLRMQH